jgi:hypothetical protein
MWIDVLNRKLESTQGGSSGYDAVPLNIHHPFMFGVVTG